MNRLVYSPKAHVFIKSGNRILDLTDYTTNGVVQRVINDVSHADITIRNPNRMFTHPGGRFEPIFRPMDPITIYLVRVRNRPIQVFTGYLDQTPYLTLFPEEVTLKATCTIKKLALTYFDPALPYTQEILYEYGWRPVGNGQWRNVSEDIFETQDNSDQDRNEERNSQDDNPNSDQSRTGQKSGTKASSFFNGMAASTSSLEDLIPIVNQVAGSDKPIVDRKEIDPRASIKELKDNNLGVLISAVVSQIGNWEEKDIVVEKLPPGIADRVANMAIAFNGGIHNEKEEKDEDEDNENAEENQSGRKNSVKARESRGDGGKTEIIGEVVERSPTGNDREQADGPHQFNNSELREELSAFLKKLIGVANLSGSSAGASAGDSVSGPLGDCKDFPIKNKYSICELVQLAMTQPFPDPPYAAAVMMSESAGGYRTIYNGSCCRGLWQINDGNNIPGGRKCQEDPCCATKWAYQNWVNSGRRWTCAQWQVTCSWDNAVNTKGQMAEARECYKRLKAQKDENNDSEELTKPNTKRLNELPQGLRDASVKVSTKKARGDDVTNDAKAEEDTESSDKIVKPVPEQYFKNITGQFGEQRPGHRHAGIDFGCPTGTPLYAVKDGKVSYASSEGGYGNYLIVTNNDGWDCGYGHCQSFVKRKGDEVKAGDVVAKADNTGSSFGSHLHFNVGKNGARTFEQNIDPMKYLKGAIGPTGQSSDTSGGGGGTVTAEDILPIASAAAFATMVDLPGTLEMAEAIMLQGDKSLMNDEPLLPFVQQLCQAGLRSFQSTPDGRFFAFYPDYFGSLNHRQAYWEINDIEILDGKIQLTDEALATHVYVVGDTLMAGEQARIFNRLNTGGVINIFQAFQSDFMIYKGEGIEELPDKATKGDEGTTRFGKDVKKKKPDKEEETWINPNPGMSKLDRKDYEAAIKFLQRYGARPYVQDAPMIRSPYYEAFYAYQTFQLLWSKQFLTTFTFTFMPELYPGGLVRLPGHNLQLFVDSVRHEWNYESGFTTQANLSAPSYLAKEGGAENIPLGMIVAGS